MKKIGQHMLALLNSAFLAGNVKAVQYKENMEPMRELTITAVDMETGYVMAQDGAGRLVPLDMSSDILLPKPEDRPGNESGLKTRKIYQVPFAYERYGYILAAAKNVKEAYEVAQTILENMSETEMERRSAYLEDSAELDADGTMLDAAGRPVDETA